MKACSQYYVLIEKATFLVAPADRHCRVDAGGRPNDPAIEAGGRCALHPPQGAGGGCASPIYPASGFMIEGEKTLDDTLGIQVPRIISPLIDRPRGKDCRQSNETRVPLKPSEPNYKVLLLS